MLIDGKILFWETELTHLRSAQKQLKSRFRWWHVLWNPYNQEYNELGRDFAFCKAQLAVIESDRNFAQYAGRAGLTLMHDKYLPQEQAHG